MGYQEERTALAGVIAKATLAVAVNGMAPYHTICMALMDNMVATITALPNDARRKSIVDAICYDLRKKTGV